VLLDYRERTFATIFTHFGSFTLLGIFAHNYMRSTYDAMKERGERGSKRLSVWVFPDTLWIHRSVLSSRFWIHVLHFVSFFGKKKILFCFYMSAGGLYFEEDSFQ